MFSLCCLVALFKAASESCAPLDYGYDPPRGSTKVRRRKMATGVQIDVLASVLAAISKRLNSESFEHLVQTHFRASNGLFEPPIDRAQQCLS